MTERQKAGCTLDKNSFQCNKNMMLSTAAVLIKMQAMSISSEHFRSVHSPGWNANSFENKGCRCGMLRLYCPLSYCCILYILEIP